MSSIQSKYDRKLMMLSVVIVITLAIAFHFNWDITKVIIRTVLEHSLTYFLSWAITVLIFIVHYSRLKSKDVQSEAIITKKFGAFIDNGLGGVTYATAITTALTLIKGLYIQKFFTDKIYFVEFNDFDLMTVFGLMAFLLYTSVMKVIDIAKEAYQVQQTEQVFTEDKIEVVQDSNAIINESLIINNSGESTS